MIKNTKAFTVNKLNIVERKMKKGQEKECDKEKPLKREQIKRFIKDEGKLQ